MQTARLWLKNCADQLCGCTQDQALGGTTHVAVGEERREAGRADIMHQADECGHKDSIGRSKQCARIKAVLVQVTAQARFQVVFRNG